MDLKIFFENHLTCVGCVGVTDSVRAAALLSKLSCLSGDPFKGNSDRISAWSDTFGVSVLEGNNTQNED